MSFIGGVVREALTIKIKYRHDGVTDQFSRILMSKMFIIAAFVMSIDFFSDRVSCIVGNDVIGPKEFVHSACWIQGFYVYEQLTYREETGYYGMPKNIDLDGMQGEKKLCSQFDKGTQKRVPECEPLTKTYYTQYQYFAFYVASLAVLSYLPYLLFRVINSDLISMKGNIKKDECTKTNAISLTDNYFNYEANGGVAVLRLKTLANILLKAIYVAINIGGFLFTDKLLNNKFINYGIQWVKWAQLRNYLAYDNKHLRGEPKPGNLLLPTMGFCDITIGSLDRKRLIVNDRRFVCEISTHILYQYVLLVLWFLFVAGVLMSTVGFVLHVGDITMTLIRCALPKNQSHQRFGFDLLIRDPMYTACKRLTIREIEYMRYIRKQNYGLYHSIIRNIQPRCNLEIPTHL